MSGETLLMIAVFVGLFVLNPLYHLWKSRRDYKRSQEEAAKSEALFQAMFTDLQPLFHPQNVVNFVHDLVELRRSMKQPWVDPPGFSPRAKRAVFEETPKGTRTILEDEAGAKIGEFLFQPGDKSPTIGMVRVGEGKFRVKHKSGKAPYASYWHPLREFDWRGPGLWTFRTTVTDSSVDSSSNGTNWSSSSSSSPSTTATAAAATAGLVAAGGTFDGGGASAGWDGGGADGGGSSSSDSSESTATASSTSY